MWKNGFFSISEIKRMNKEGATTKEIADKMHIPEATVKEYIDKMTPIPQEETKAEPVLQPAKKRYSSRNKDHITPDMDEKIRGLIRTGASIREINRQTGVNRDILAKLYPEAKWGRNKGGAVASTIDLDELNRKAKSSELPPVVKPKPVENASHLVITRKVVELSLKLRHGEMEFVEGHPVKLRLDNGPDICFAFSQLDDRIKLLEEKERYYREIIEDLKEVKDKFSDLAKG